MNLNWSIPIGNARTVRIVSTRGADFAVAGPDQARLQRLRAEITPYPWTWLNQVHGARLVEVTRAGQWAGSVADGAWTAHASCPISVNTADCAPVVLVASGGVAVVHAGWRGALAGIISEAAAALRGQGWEPVATVLGPCISAAKYEFSPSDLLPIVDEFGDSVVGRTDSGQTALDMSSLVGVCCSRAGWPIPEASECTSSEGLFSFRGTGASERQTTVAWIEDKKPGSSTAEAGAVEDGAAN